MRTRNIMLCCLLAALACETEKPESELPTVEVTSEGNDKARPLAIEVGADHTETVTFSLAVNGSGSVNGKSSPESGVALAFTITAKVTEISEHGIRAELAVQQYDADALPEPLRVTLPGGALSAPDQVIKALEHLPELEGELVITPSGFITKLELGVKKFGLSNQQRQVVEAIRSTIAQLAIPRPLKATAPAQWKATVAAARNGFKVSQDLQLALESSGAIRLTLVEKLGDKGISVPGVYADSIEVKSYSGQGSGMVELGPKLIFPAKARLELDATSSLSVEQAEATDIVESRAKLTIVAQSE